MSIIQGREYRLPYSAYDAVLNTFKTGDAANHTINVKQDDGSAAAITYTPTEIANGKYEALLTSAEMDGRIVIPDGASTGNTRLILPSGIATVRRPFRSSRGNAVEVMVRRTEADDGSVSTNTQTRTFLAAGHRQRIQKSGTVRSVKLEVTSSGGLDELRFRIFRLNNTDDNYDEVGASNAISTGWINDTLVTFNLTTPIEGVESGDFLGVVVDSGSGNTNIATRSGLDVEDFVIAWDAGDKTGDDVTFANAFDGRAIYLTAVMDAPVAVAMGDSFLGHTSNTPSFSYLLATGTVWEDVIAGRSIPERMYDIEPELCDFQNHSISSSTAEQWATTGFDWVTSLVTDLTPKYALISLGVNDPEPPHNRTFVQWIEDMQDIFHSLTAASVWPVVLSILHTDTAESRKRSWNDWLEKHCERNGYLFVDGWKLLADLTAEEEDRDSKFGGDVHPAIAGVDAIAGAVVERLIREGW